MNINVELVLFYAVIICGVLALIGKQLRLPLKPVAAQLPRGRYVLATIYDYAHSFFPVLLLVFLLRSFLYEPFRIPTGSLEPTLHIGDFIFVNKFDYGVRLPITHKKIFGKGEPQRGDIMVFRWPPDPSINYIKRVIGVPGDKISYIDKVLYVNGEKAPQQFEKNAIDMDSNGTSQPVLQKRETFFGIEHAIYQIENDPAIDFHDLVVPEGMYFMMGDNRDSSADSRFWGFVPENNIVGKATLVWMSWNSFADNWGSYIRWNRIGHPIH